MISVFGCRMSEIEKANVVACLDTNWLGLGKVVESFEARFAKHIGAEFLMTDNCSNALYMAVKLLNLPPQSRVIVPSLTWVSCAHAIVLAGHIPVFADVDIETMNVTRETVDAAGKSSALMVVHYAGLSVDMDAFDGIGIPIIEDAAHAVNSTYNGVACGTIGNVGCFSFDATKNLASCDGGGITYKDGLERAKTLRYCGIGKSGFESATASNVRWWEYDIKECFIRMTPNNVSAAIAMGQLDRLEQLQAHRKLIWDSYKLSFERYGWIIRPQEARHGRHSYFTYAIRVPYRDRLARYLLDNGVYTTLRFHPLHMNPIYKSGVSLKNCEQLNRDTLNLPIHPNLTFSDVDKIVDLICAFGKRNSL